jgi:hypothetical protein
MTPRHARPEPKVIVVPTAPDLVLSSEAPKFLRTVTERNRWRREKARQIGQKLDLFASPLPGEILYDLVCKEFKNDPFVKQHKLSPPSKTTTLRALGKKR